ncbi:MAG: ADP-ribosylglycohydrolase family protein [Armatimonadota bacterium]
MAEISTSDRIKGALVGSVIGAELGYSRIAAPNNFTVSSPMDIFNVKLEPVLNPGFSRTGKWYASATPFIDLGVRSYIQKQGRVTPEDFGNLLKDDEGIAEPVFMWDPIHTTQELLKEGMNPRITGYGNVPCGYISACMPAVGIYHLADPDYAYIDGVEIASVNQPRLGADWAGLSAAAIASAFEPNATPESIIETVLRIAKEKNKDLFYQLNQPFKWGGFAGIGEEWFLNHWYYNSTESGARNEKGYCTFNPISRVLPMISRYGNDIKKLMAVLIGPPQDVSLVSGVIAGAVMGALHGIDAFPDEWRAWAEPLAESWYPIEDLVKSRIDKEKKIISVVDSISQKDGNGESILFDKIYGCLLAGAIGNAMGSPVENQHYLDIEEKYPDGVKTILNTAALENEDDNQMAMMLVETYLRSEGLPVTARDFGRTWTESMNRDKFFVNCMGHCYDQIRNGWDPRITGHWVQVTGSTVMCMEPVGIYHIADPEYAYTDAKAISYMYQRGLDVVAASLLAAVVAEAFRPEATVDSVCSTALSLAPTEPLKTFDKRRFSSVRDYFETCLEVAGKYDDVFEARKEIFDKCLMYFSIDPLEVIGLSLVMFKIANGDVRQAAIGGTNIGRDSDTISGRASMLTGILRGSKAVPEDWIAMFKPEVLEKIQRNSKRLANMLEIKNSRLKKRAFIS